MQPSVKVEPSPTSQIPDRLRRLAARLDRPRDKELLAKAATRIVDLERRLGIKSNHRLKLIDQPMDVEGKRITFSQLIELYGADGLTLNTASTRYYGRGWPLIEAISTPVNRKGSGKYEKKINTLTLRSERCKPVEE